METDAAGRYRASNLTLGSYEVSVEMAGFRTSVRRGLQLTIGAEAVVNLTLSIGAVTEQVEVTAEAPMVETTSATVSGLVDNQQIRDLPLNGRSFENLAILQDGVTAFRRGTQSTENGSGLKFSVSGSRPNTNSFLLDGTIINDSQNFSPGSAANVMLGVDTLREFQVLTNTYSAEHGRHMGGVVNAVTKSGTNNLHGTAFYFHRNDNFDANNFFNNKANKEKPEFKRNQWGGNVGGPIVKDRTHFFAGYEGLRARDARVASGFVPSAEAHVAPNIDPAVRPYLDLFPLPNGQNVSPNVARHTSNPSKPTNEDYLVGKIDHRFNDSHFMFGRYTISDSDTADPNNNHVHTLERVARNQYITLEETSAISPTVINVVRASVARAFSNSINTLFFDVSQLPLFVPGQQLGLITINESGITFGNDIAQPQLWGRTTWQFSDDVTFVSGSHTFKAGFMFDRIQENTTKHRQNGGAWEFENVAAFLANEPNEIGFPPANNDPQRGMRQSIMGLYLQDDFQVRPNLTLNWGLRWEMATVPTEHHGRIANYSDRLNDVAAAPHIGNPWFEGGQKDFGPRIGLAWDPFSNGKTSIRSGFGVFFDHVSGSPYNRAIARVYPFHGSFTLDHDLTFPTVAANLIGTPDPLALTNYSLDPILKDPTRVNWTFTLQQEVARDTVATATYSGSHAYHMNSRHVGNGAPIEIDPVTGREFVRHKNGAAPRSQADRVNPNLGQLDIFIANDSGALYHGLSLGLRRRMGQGLQAQVSYTWSKNLSTSDGALGRDVNSASALVSSQIPFNLAADKSPALFDMRNSFTANFIYELPFARSATGAAHAILAGWSLNSILTLQDGLPQNLILNFDRNRVRVSSGARSERPELIPGGNINPVLDSRDPDAYYDPSQFTLASIVDIPGTTDKAAFFGNVARNSLVSPGLANLDFSLVKDTAVSENTSLQFKAEVFNVLNRANFSLPFGQPLTSSGGINGRAGTISETIGENRQIQFALKYIF